MQRCFPRDRLSRFPCQVRPSLSWVPLRQRVVLGSAQRPPPPVHKVHRASTPFKRYLITSSFSSDGGRRRDGARVGEAALHGARSLLNEKSSSDGGAPQRYQQHQTATHHYTTGQNKSIWGIISMEVQITVNAAIRSWPATSFRNPTYSTHFDVEMSYSYCSIPINVRHIRILKCRIDIILGRLPDFIMMMSQQITLTKCA